MTKRLVGGSSSSSGGGDGTVFLIVWKLKIFSP